MANGALPISVIPMAEWQDRNPEDVAREEAFLEAARRAQMEMLGDVAKSHWQQYGHAVDRGSKLLQAKDGSLLTPREAMYHNIMADRASRQVLPEVEKPGWENMVNRGHYTYPMLKPFEVGFQGLVDLSNRAASIPEGVLEGATDFVNEGMPPIHGIERGIAGVFDSRLRPDRDKIYAGLAPANRLIAEVAMDPTSWVGVGALKGGTGAMVKAADSAAANAMSRMSNAVDTMRYGKGVRADLVDEAGDMIRRLRNAPRREPLRLEYAR